MAEDEWGESFDEQAVILRKGPPRWAIFVGIGCLLVLGIGIAVMAVGFLFFRNATDPEKLWTHIQEILPFDERPADLEPLFGMDIPGSEEYHVSDSRGRFQLIVRRFNKGRERETEGQLDPESFLYGMALNEAQRGTLVLQGREAPCMWYTHLGSRRTLEGLANADGIRIDLQGRGDWPIVIELMKLDSDLELSEQLLGEWLEPFDLWRDR